MLKTPRPSYIVPAETLEKTLIIKKSRFIACAKMIHCREDAKTFLQIKKIEFPDARHHCWAYLIGNPESASNAAMSDDGEPSGTAGKPILNVIQHKKMGDVMVVVTRYFGGVKLGAGGLTRAYSGATEMVLSELKRKEKVFLSLVFIDCDFSQEQTMRHWADGNKAILTVIGYTQQVELKIELPHEKIQALEAFCLANNMQIRFEKN